MLTKADDYPIHQTAEPIAYSGSDRNFYDRYFFNGYSPDGETFFAAAMGVYPHLNIIDAAFSVVRNGVQHNLHASRVLHLERLDTVVGPIALTVVEPLKHLRLTVSSPAHGLRAEVAFHARAQAIEEPRFTRRIGARTVLDYTRLTQNGRYEGSIQIENDRIDLSGMLGTRDRSWGVRPIGASDPQPTLPLQMPQFYWLWAPCNYEQHISLFHDNADADGTPWNRRGVIAPTGDGPIDEYDDVEEQLTYRSGSRRVASARLSFRKRGREEIRVILQPEWNFYMPGIGYMHPDWGHGLFKGDLAVGYDRYRHDQVDDNVPALMHVQAISRAQLERSDGTLHSGRGVLEQLIIGPHAPSGFTQLFDQAP